MESPGDYMDSMTDDDLAYPCKGCGEILEEGKAFELAGNRWHLDCFRCNTCGTLLDSDANLLLLGDGSLICNNCTYSCSACGNKIEDLAILTGDQAFCATCFRCRNCKRKIENLRYARTSQGIFCMSCHESLMARRRKKSRAAAQQKAKKDEQSHMLSEKSLPALPPSALDEPFSPEREAPDVERHTELSPRPRPAYGRRDSEQSKDNLTLPTTTYKKNRHSIISQGSELGGGDGDSYFIPLALDPSPAPAVTPGSRTDGWQDSSKRGRDNRDVTSPKASGRATDSGGSTPHIAFQEKGRQTSSDALETSQQQIIESIRKAQAAASRKGPPSKSDDTKAQHAGSPGSVNGNDKNLGQTEKFRLGDVPKSKKSGSSKNDSQTEIAANESPVSRSASSGGLSTVPRKEVATGSPRTSANRQSEESRAKDEADSKPSTESGATSLPPSRADSGAKSIPRKELPSSVSKNNEATVNQFESDASSSASSDTPGVTPTMNGKSGSGATFLQSPIDEDMALPSRAPNRPQGPQQTLSDTYMTPRAPPQPPSGSHIAGKESSGSSNGAQVSPKLPRWSAGGDFTMDEDLARILGNNDENSQSILRRVSNAVRHGRTTSETSNSARHQGHGRSISETTRTTASPRWPKTPVGDETNMGAREISSPISMSSPSASDDPALLRRRLRNSEQRVAELERQFATEKDLKDLNKKLIEKRKTVSVLDSQSEIMLRQVEVLAGYVEKAKASKQALNIAELEDSAIKEFVQKLEHLKLSLSGQIEALYEERNDLLEEKNQITADRDRALVEFEQLSSKNAQLADMNNDLTHQIQERFKAQSANVDSPRHGLGIYTHMKDKSSASFADDATTVRSGSTTVYGSEQDPTVESAVPHVVNIRKGQAKKFNWKKGGQTVAKGVSKGFKGAFSSSGQERNQWAGQTGDNIGLPYNMTVTAVDAPAPHSNTLPRNAMNDPSRQGFGLFKKSNTVPKGASNGTAGAATAAAESPAVLFGSELVERADYERRQIPSVVTRCIEEVELRGMDVEGIYRKTGGSGQVKIIQEGFDKTEDFDISDPDLDITAVTSVLKQYFRKLPTPLLTFDIYDRVLESTTIEDDQERCAHLKKTFALLPPKHRDCLEFLIFHLVRVAKREKENLMTPKNLAVVFAPTIMRDQSIEREMTDTHAKNNAVQFIIENSNEIFGSA
ncbi:hypothetical protein F5884DRAFT_428138 [Xylogone sp. PMI_703]|nr:hypothetical protein F5884DRAFT_428138 [Xylogone sp. PMI_703]